MTTKWCISTINNIITIDTLIALTLYGTHLFKANLFRLSIVTLELLYHFQNGKQFITIDTPIALTLYGRHFFKGNQVYL